MAAGSTAVTIVPTAMQLPLFTITIDDPFLYAIRDDHAGEVLFDGTLMIPT